MSRSDDVRPATESNPTHRAGIEGDAGRSRSRPPTGAGRRLSTLRKTVYTVVTVLVFVALFEGGFRLAGIGRRQEVADYIANWQQQWNGEFYVYRPGMFGQINSDGVRDRDHVVPKPPGLTRIVCLGDSVTFGYGVAPAHSYPSILEQLLSTQNGAEVFNVALPGWSTRQEAVAWKTIARKYRPDVVILGVCLNDIPEMGNNLSERPGKLLALLHARSNVVRWALRAHAKEIHSVEELFALANEAHVREAWQRFFDELEKFSTLVRQDGSRFVVLMFPFRFQLDSEAPEPLPQQMVADFCSANELDFVDGLPALKALGGKAFIDYDHLSRDGATAIAERLIEANVVSPDMTSAIGSR